MNKDTLLIGGAILIIGIIALAVMLTQQAGELNQLRYQYNALATSTVSRDELQATITSLSSAFQSALAQRDAQIYSLKTELNSFNAQLNQAVAQAERQIIQAIDTRFNYQNQYAPPQAAYPYGATTTNTSANYYGGYTYAGSPSGTTVTTLSSQCVRITLPSGVDIAVCFNH